MVSPKLRITCDSASHPGATSNSCTLSRWGHRQYPCTREESSPGYNDLRIFRQGSWQGLLNGVRCLVPANLQDRPVDLVGSVLHAQFARYRSTFIDVDCTCFRILRHIKSWTTHQWSYTTASQCEAWAPQRADGILQAKGCQIATCDRIYQGLLWERCPSLMKKASRRNQ